MIPNDVENNISHSISNISTVSQPSTTLTSSSRDNTNYSLINTLITTDTRRSVRLSAKSSKRISSLNQSSIHRTISGGVALTHSPKLNVRKRTSDSTDTQGTSTSSISYSTITSNDNGGMHDSNNKNSTSYRDFPSDQSDDDEISTNNSVVIKQKSTGLLTRSEVLSYFLVQDNGYKSNLCDCYSVL
ncbi:unnamed protein product [Rotaria sp. Silwood1]|nr:unnamed protein product [Rotaria sp. Silwood1]CAF1554479.1 unnamed protein product [Rotaria sp. Silwood1]CAF1692078.1 unnamed protein product [Rotaria sp. Silwood1]CAF1692079.1 unnamed protein product [Rotaria sp. Silwood1]